MGANFSIKVKAKGKRAQQVAQALTGVDIPQRGGNTRLAAGSLKYQGLLGRRGNLANKAKFKLGSVAKEN